MSLPVLAAASDGLPTWVTVGLTPALVVFLLLSGQLRWGKGVDQDKAEAKASLAKAETRAEAAEARERTLQQAFMDKVLPLQERQLLLMQQVQDFLRSLVPGRG